MYYDEDTDEIIRCPYCNRSKGCKHLFAIHDETYRHLSGGYLSDKVLPLVENIRQHFEQHIANYGYEKDSYNSDHWAMKELWYQMLDEKDYCESVGYEICVENTCQYGNVISAIVEASDLISRPGVSGNPFTGDSMYGIIYVEDVKQAHKDLLQTLDKLLNPNS